MLNEKHENFMTKDMIGMSPSLSFENHSHSYSVEVSSANYKAYEDLKDFQDVLSRPVQCHFQLCKTSIV